MELSLWPSGRCSLLWVAFPSLLPQGGHEGRAYVCVVRGHGEQTGCLGNPTPPSLHGHVKVAFYRETPEEVKKGGWHGSADRLKRKAEH